MPDRKTVERKGGCFKYGCLGCVALLVLLLIAAGTIVAIGLMLGAPEERVERPQLVRELAAPVAGDASEDRAETEPIGELIPPDELTGRVILDLNEGSFRIVPAPPGEPIRVDGRYDAGTYELTESFERQEGEGWVYRVSFARRVSWIRAMFKEDDQDNRINISLPRGTPFVLEGSIGVGESILDLGGLAVRDVGLELGTGAHELNFSEPAPFPMESFNLEGAIGELRVSGLGNASPQLVKVSHRIGEVSIDLRGAWLRDAEVSIRCGIGECGVRVPDNVNLDLLSADVSLGEVTDSGLDLSRPAEQGLPTLRLDLSGRIGEVRVSR